MMNVPYNSLSKLGRHQSWAAANQAHEPDTKSSFHRVFIDDVMRQQYRLLLAVQVKQL